jgi:hypothetical protein
MIGKLFVPLAIGGGLIFLLSSAASASPSSSAGSAPKNPFDQLPDNLRQLAGQAQATNNPDMLEQMATQLEIRGFSDPARLLRVQATALRQRSQNVFDQLPENLKQLAGQAQATNDPGTLEQVAAQLEAQGFREQPRLLRAQATALRERSQSLVATQAGASSPGIVPGASSGSSQPAVLSPELQKMVADAIQNGTPPILTSTAFVLEKAGFQAAADELKRRAKEAAASVPPPPVQDHPNAALDPSMPADLALQVARQLQLQGDPAALDMLATELRNRGFNTTADQVQAKAQQIRTMLDAARTMHDIDSEFKAPVAPTPSTLPASAAPFPSPATPAASTPPTGTFPVTVTATPPAPLPVPSSPQPQAPAPEKSKAQILAEALSSSLNDLLDRYGSVPKARFKEDKGLVTRFQSQEGLTSDGNYGPTTAEHVGRYVADVPPPFYWKKGAGQRDLSTYRSNIQTLALEADQVGKTDRAERLRQSALKASLA